MESLNVIPVTLQQGTKDWFLMGKFTLTSSTTYQYHLVKNLDWPEGILILSNLTPYAIRIWKKAPTTSDATKKKVMTWIDTGSAVRLFVSQKDELVLEVSRRYGNRLRGLSGKSTSFLLDKLKMSISGEEDQSFE
eukprot:9577755-Ditylum_brightwellii.AAC.1